MKAIFHLFTICLLAPWSEGKLLKRSLSGYHLAKCNDGTPANYYYTPDLLNADKLVINLQGGGACYDKQGCQNRFVNHHRHNDTYPQVQEWKPPLHRVYRRVEGSDKDDVEFGP